jgi:hypothetical protein
VGRKDTARVKNEHVEVTVRDKSGVVATRLVPLAGSARLTAAQKAAAARVWMAPRVTAVRGRVAEEYVPRLADAVAAAVAASEPVRTAAMTRGGLALAALKGEQLQVVQPKRRRRGRKVVGFVGLAGIAAAVVAWWRSQQQPVAPWEDSGSSSPSSRSSVYPATGGTGATGASSADTTATGSRLDSSTDTSEPPGPVLATSASPSGLGNYGETSGDLATPSTAMGTTSESTSADPAGDSTSQSPSPDDVSTMDAPEDSAEDSAAERATETAGEITGDTPRKATRSRPSRSTSGDAT